MKEIEPAIVLAKLDFMTDYLESLSSFESITLEEYLSDRGKQLIIERLLQLIIQVAIDVNRYLLKRLEVQQPNSNFDVFIEVSNCGIITAELAKILSQSGVLRNRLVHLYDAIDPVKVHQAIDIVLQKYPIYQRQVTTYLDSLRDNNISGID
ncbi:type VII toxin-antitoxin system HepT family RNase toxin [Microcoleus sp. D2_18a_D3]|uniref:type VII toxin-antitoxin system HepT family RNase toxin n=1 Tax=Microcoleus sp. D2_18a_D3 TaxID=3055330 RepID=UPI002FD422F9